MNKRDDEGRFVTQEKEEKLKDEISQLKNCLRDKDKRLTKIEKQIRND